MNSFIGDDFEYLLRRATIKSFCVCDVEVGILDIFDVFFLDQTVVETVSLDNAVAVLRK